MIRGPQPGGRPVGRIVTDDADGPGRDGAAEKHEVDPCGQLDFGLARLQVAGSAADEAAGLTQAGLIFGTPAYMSPEQAAGRDLDSRSDIYSLGAVAHFLATGQPPFVCATVVQTLAAHINEPVASLQALRSDLPDDLQDAVLRCLAIDPAERFPDVESLDRALRACGAARDWSETDAAAWWKATPVSEWPAQNQILESA